MNHERETLTRNLEDLRAKIAEASQASYDQEMQVTRSMDRFEQLLADYTSLAHQIGTIVPLPEAGAVDYVIDLELGVEDVSEVQAAGRKMKDVIRPALQTLADRYRKELQGHANDLIQLEDKFDRLGQDVTKQRDEAANLEMRLKVVHEQAEEMKNVSSVVDGRY